MKIQRKLFVPLISLAICIVAFSTIKKVPPHAFDKIKVEGGEITGIVNGGGDIHIFKGVPFAAPPVGALRWQEPQPVAPWTGVKACDKLGPSPMQAKPKPFSMWTSEFLIPEEPISEDCLYLNVWTGANSNKEKRPVLVWIYGGGFSSGGSGCPIYDGEAMAKKGIIFVSINYRVGLFGFFAHPELTKESGHNTSGNYGLMDQIAALRWVQKNIAAFGGDPSNVTIAGQSAGSMSVNCLVASPLAKNLFNKAIGESGANFSNSNSSLQKAEEDGQKLAQSLNATSLADLRGITADEIMKKTQAFRGPIIDGYVLPEPIVNIFKEGKENKVALLTGWNQDEGFMFGPPKKADEFKKEANEKYGADAATFLKYYPAGTDAEAAASQVNLSRDMIFGAQNYAWANIQASQGLSTYVYRFTRKVPATGEYVKYGAFHTGEVPYAYDNLKFVNRPWEPVDHELARIMSSYFANFIKNGNPNGKDLPVWDAYDTTDKKVMILSEKPASKTIPDRDMLDFLYGKLVGK